MKIIWDSTKYHWQWGTTTVSVVPEGHQFNVNVVQVEEQDTSLLMGVQANPVVEDSKPSWYLANILERQNEYTPGDVLLMRNASRCVLKAVVHNVELTPTWKEDWVALALENILSQVRQHDITALALPFLGCEFGDLKTEHFLALLQRHFTNSCPTCLKQIWLVAPASLDYALFDNLLSNS